MYALKQNPSGEVKLDLSSVVANMSTSKSTVRDKKTQLSSVHSVEADLSVVKDDSVVSVSSIGLGNMLCVIYILYVYLLYCLSVHPRCHLGR